ncbi:uncharacterized protein LOC143217044 [Lasioglossum baleicum]|uniref:uncharacterized protein LOC143217044 n=1 Tax=Lasioglossum baleicum TaxID=434251 RepID=UPI003FCC8C50
MVDDLDSTVLISFELMDRIRASLVPRMELFVTYRFITTINTPERPLRCVHTEAIRSSFLPNKRRRRSGRGASSIFSNVDDALGSIRHPVYTRVRTETQVHALLPSAENRRRGDGGCRRQKKDGL